MALGDIHLRFAWQAWHLETSTFVSRGRRGTYGTGLALVALVAGTTLSHTIFHTPSFTPSFTTPSFTHHFVTHHLSHITLSHTIFHHTIFRTQLCHTPSFATPSFTHTPLCHTPSFTHNFVLLVGPSPHPLSFLLSLSPLQHLVLIIGRSCLVELSDPLIVLLILSKSQIEEVS